MYMPTQSQPSQEVGTGASGTSAVAAGGTGGGGGSQ